MLSISIWTKSTRAQAAGGLAVVAQSCRTKHTIQKGKSNPVLPHGLKRLDYCIICTVKKRFYTEH
jgi:hypothetical protein